MTPLESTPAKRPPFYTAAVLLHAACGFLALAAAGTLAALAGTGTLVTTTVGLATQEEDTVPAILILVLVTSVLLVIAVTSALSLFLAWKAWGMKRFWVWALVIWSIVHLSSGCGIFLTILTVIGGMQVLEQDRERAGAA
jgi:hypothetical protein